MFYSILPPIIVVLSLVGIIIFLVKKSSKIKKVYQDDAIDVAKKESMGMNDTAISTDEQNEVSWKKAENFFLIGLEKTARRLRALFLKLEVWFSGLSGRIRNRRNGVSSIVVKNNSEKEPEEKVLEKIISYKSKNVSGNNTIIREKFGIDVETEKIAEPMISKKATLPRAVPGVKNKLEELLIERVAANPKDVEAYERLGEYYMEIETYNDAKECFKQVMKLSPTNRNVKYKIKRLERLLGE